MVPCTKAKLGSVVVFLYEVKISLDAKRVPCLKGLSELERIGLVGLPERRNKKINHELGQKEMTDVLSLFWTNQTLYCCS